MKVTKGWILTMKEESLRCDPSFRSGAPQGGKLREADYLKQRSTNRASRVLTR